MNSVLSNIEKLDTYILRRNEYVAESKDEPNKLNTSRKLEVTTKKNQSNNKKRPPPINKARKSLPSIFRRAEENKDSAKIITPTGSKIIGSPLYKRSKSDSFFDHAFNFDKNLGKGSFGEVVAATCRSTSKKFAIKKIPFSKLSKDQYREAYGHMNIPCHPNIVRFHQAWIDKQILHIQLEMCDKSLAAYCHGIDWLEDKELWNVFLDILQGLGHLHNNFMLHNDIKPDNIFMTKNKVCKLGDFGLISDMRSEPINNSSNKHYQSEGDGKYCSKEAINGTLSIFSDIFSFGISILEVGTNIHLPSYGTGWEPIRKWEIPEEILEPMSDELRELVKQMMDKAPTRRPTCSELMKNHVVKEKLRIRKQEVEHIPSESQFQPISYLTTESPLGSRESSCSSIDFLDHFENAEKKTPFVSKLNFDLEDDEDEYEVFSPPRTPVKKSRYQQTMPEVSPPRKIQKLFQRKNLFDE